jgi:hypothetical protein
MTGYDAEEVIGKSPKMLQGPILTRISKAGACTQKLGISEMTTLNYKKMEKNSG